MANQDVVKHSIAEAMKNLVREKSVENISISDICEGSQVNRRTFYRYFSDKYEVIEWIHYNDFLQRLHVPAGKGLYYYMIASADLVIEDKAYYLNALKYRGQNSFRQYCAHHLRALCYQDFRPCFSSDELYDIYICHSIETAFDFLEYILATRPNLAPEELKQIFRDMFYKPSKRYVELLEGEYQHPQDGVPYRVKEPTRAPKKA